MPERTVKFLVVDGNEPIRNLLCSLLEAMYPSS